MVMRFLLCPNLLCAYSNPLTILSEETTSVKKENNNFQLMGIFSPGIYNKILCLA
jgi:hypothetical protein